MEKFIQGPAWQGLVFLFTLYYVIITPITTVVPSIKHFFFKDRLRIYLFILIYILPLYYGILTLLATIEPLIRDFIFKDQFHIYLFTLLYILPFITFLAFKKVRVSLLIIFWLIWHFFVSHFKSNTDRRKPNQPWVYDFYEKYNEAIAYRMPEYKQCGPEMSGKEPKKALRAQPPPNDSGWYLYKVLLPEKLRQLELSFYIGIRDMIEIPIGASVRFEVKVDGVVKFSKDYGEHKWQYNVVKLDVEHGNDITISFETKVRATWMGYGTIWGEPVLKGIL